MVSHLMWVGPLSSLKNHLIELLATVNDPSSHSYNIPTRISKFSYPCRENTPYTFLTGHHYFVLLLYQPLLNLLISFISIYKKLQLFYFLTPLVCATSVSTITKPTYFFLSIYNKLKLFYFRKITMYEIPSILFF